MFCMYCGTILEEDSKFCIACGKSVKKTNENQLKTEIKNIEIKSTDIKTKGKRKFFIIGAAIIGIFLLFANIHTCDWCNKTYIGAQYYDMWDSSELMCKKCATQYYMGLNIKNFKK